MRGGACSEKLCFDIAMEDLALESMEIDGISQYIRPCMAKLPTIVGARLTRSHCRGIVSRFTSRDTNETVSIVDTCY